jgi:hypothetical protein
VQKTPENEVLMPSDPIFANSFLLDTCNSQPTQPSACMREKKKEVKECDETKQDETE